MVVLFKIWRFLLPFIFIFTLVHFAKDITQDILKIPTPLDLLGNAKENLSGFSPFLRPIYLYGLGGLSILAEIFLLITIPQVWKNKEFLMMERWIVASVLFLAVFFVTATLLTPRINP